MQTLIDAVILHTFVVKLSFPEKVQLQRKQNHKFVTIDKLLYQLQTICFCLIYWKGIMEVQQGRFLLDKEILL